MIKEAVKKELIQLRVMRFEDRNNGVINLGAENEIGGALPIDKLITVIVNNEKTYKVNTDTEVKGRLINLIDVFNDNLVGAGTKLICKYEVDTMTLHIRTED